jgi:hypothetical protein
MPVSESEHAAGPELEAALIRQGSAVERGRDDAEFDVADRGRSPFMLARYSPIAAKGSPCGRHRGEAGMHAI